MGLIMAIDCVYTQMDLTLHGLILDVLRIYR